MSDGTDFWERDFYDYSTTHSVPLLGFKPGRTNLILVSVYDKARNSYTAPQLLTFVSPPLPVNFPTSTVLKSQPGAMEPGYVFFMIRNNFAKIGYIVIMNNLGEVVWYSICPNVNDLDVRPLDNGNMLIPDRSNKFLELNMLGETVSTLTPPTGYPINTHDGYPTDHGTLLYISDRSEYVPDFPSNATNSDAPLMTARVNDEPVVEISATNGALLHAWSPLDILDPTRVTYLTYGTGSGSSYGVDNEHVNAVLEDTSDNSVIVSLRNQNAVVKFDKTTGDLKWILGPPENWSADWQQYLLTPVGASFDWNYGQHSPKLTPEGTLLIYNNNNYQASSFDSPVADRDNFSSAVEYDINETNLEVSMVWNSAWQTNQDRLFTPYVGKVKWLPQTRNVLVTYGAVTYINGQPPNAIATNANMVRIIEYTHDPVPQVVLDLSFFDEDNTDPKYQGYFCYRAYQIPDLYAHPIEPVNDLVVKEEGPFSKLEFSADPAHNYLVEASTDLTNWTSIGSAVQESAAGNFDFADLETSKFTTRFYRVVTQ